jgi:hypothetical protein
MITSGNITRKNEPVRFSTLGKNCCEAYCVRLMETHTIDDVLAVKLAKFSAH